MGPQKESSTSRIEDLTQKTNDGEGWPQQTAPSSQGAKAMLQQGKCQ